MTFSLDQDTDSLFAFSFKMTVTLMAFHNMNVIIGESDQAFIRTLFVVESSNRLSPRITRVPLLKADKSETYAPVDLEPTSLPLEIVRTIILKAADDHVVNGELDLLLNCAFVTRVAFERIFKFFFGHRPDLTKVEKIQALQYLIFSAKLLMRAAEDDESMLPGVDTITFDLIVDEELFFKRHYLDIQNIGHRYLKLEPFQGDNVRKSVSIGSRPLDVIWLLGKQFPYYYHCKKFCRPIFVLHLRESHSTRMNLYHFKRENLKTFKPLKRLLRQVYGDFTTIAIITGPDLFSHQFHNFEII